MAGATTYIDLDIGRDKAVNELLRILLVCSKAVQLNKEFTKAQNTDILKLKDITIGRSVGAKAKNYDIKDPETGDIFHFVEGTKIQNSQVFAGKGTKHPLHDGVAEGLTEQFGGTLSKWQHCKGHGIFDYD